MFIFACFKTSYFYFQRTVPDWGCYNNEVATSKGTMVNKSRASFWRKNMLKFGHVGLVAKSCPTLATPWTVACQALLSMGLCRQEYWSGLPFPSPGDLPDPGIKPGSPALQADSLPTKLWIKDFFLMLHWVSREPSSHFYNFIFRFTLTDLIFYYPSKTWLTLLSLISFQVFP